jgi:hypothetical protein
MSRRSAFVRDNHAGDDATSTAGQVEVVHTIASNPATLFGWTELDTQGFKSEA